jgi:hypothetical protein
MDIVYTYKYEISFLPCPSTMVKRKAGQTLLDLGFWCLK